MLEKAFKVYTYYIFPLLVATLAFIYSLESPDHDVTFDLFRSKITLIILMVSAIYPCIYYSNRSLEHKKWARLLIGIFALASVGYIVIEEYKCLLDLFSW